MTKTTLTLLLLLPFLAAITLAQSDSRLSKGNESETRTARANTKRAHTKARFSVYHAGAWEQEIGYSQAMRVGKMLYISGTVGADEKGQPEDLDSQMKKAYGAIQKTMAHYGADLSNVVMERIYTTDIDALIKSQETRKQFYGSQCPAATWVEVRRLYKPSDKIEIEVEAVLD